jgi:hypothetical protein
VDANVGDGDSLVQLERGRRAGGSHELGIDRLRVP